MRYCHGLYEFWVFGLKQAQACVFGGFLLGLMLVTSYWYPFTALHRYDFMFLAAVVFQLLLLLFRLESPKEFWVIVVFHAVATLMEWFKTSSAIGSWSYPGAFDIGIGNVPLFAGFMYSAVGSYIARCWRIFDFKFSDYPPKIWTVWLVLLIYLNFFTHHYLLDIRWLLLLAVLWLFGRTTIHFKVTKKYRKMPLLVGWFLVAWFIWLAENVGTFTQMWIYPTQNGQWQMVPLSKLVAWFLLMQLSFVLVSLLHQPGKARFRSMIDSPR